MVKKMETKAYLEMYREVGVEGKEVVVGAQQDEVVTTGGVYG